MPAPGAKPPIEEQPTTTLPPVSGPMKQPASPPGDRPKPAATAAPNPAQPTVALTKTPAPVKTPPPSPAPVPPRPASPAAPRPAAGAPQPVAGAPKPAKPHPLPAPAERGLNKNALPALLFSFFGITAPVGVYLGRKARQEIARTGETGDPYAVAALFIGWAYITAFGLGVASYLIFVIGGS